MTTLAEPKLTIIEARETWNRDDLKELWRYRELFWHLTLRDIKIRYKQTILGLGWALVQPLATMLVFIVFIGWMGKVSAGIENYTLFVLCGVLPWTFFANAVTNSANSLLVNERLVTKIFFPRVLLPAASVGAALFDFLIGLVVVVGWVLIAGPGLSWHLPLAIGFVGLLCLTAFGFGLALSALIAVQRDFRYILTFGVQLWMFATPCIYLPPSKYPFGPAAQQWLALNPAYGLILNFRACMLGEPLNWPAAGLSTLVAALVCAMALLYFRKVENGLADTI